MAHRHDVERFSRWAPSYDRHWMQRRIFEPVQGTALDLAAEEVPRPRAILDVGCGTGRLVRSAEARFPGARLVGVDAAPGMVAHAQASVRPGGLVRFEQAVAEALPFPDRTFDLVFSTLTFHHWADQPRGIAEVARVMSPGGRWMLADVMPSGLIGFGTRLFRQDQFPDPR
ncbi:MAG TPA: class I SAM-dependent methyltransferase, partial [Candidatus Dormibacteraeota bacterium]